MELRSFAVDEAAVVASWATTADEVAKWCSRQGSSVPVEVVAGWSAADDVDAFVLTDGDTAVVAYGELWDDDDECEVELARLIVRPDRRGRGIGRLLVERLAELALQRQPLATMRVHPENEPALRAYAAAGFTHVSAEDASSWNVGQPVAFTWMVRRRR